MISDVSETPVPAEVDYVVVGGGAAGCVLAARLSENPAWTVALLECGGRNDDARVRTPGLAAALSDSEMAWPTPTAPQSELGGRSVPLITGTGLGGGSAINSMGWFHGQPDDYEGWVAAGATGWGWSEMAAHLRHAEDHELGATVFHGAAGPMAVGSPRHVHPLSYAFLRAGLEQGWPISHDLNGEQRTGVSLAPVNIRDGARHSVVDGYLMPAASRRNLSVLLHARVLRLAMEGRRVTGALWAPGNDDDKGPGQAIAARRGVILCAGAIGTPQIMMLSGLGPADDLRRHGISVCRDLPAVGGHLQDHPAVPIPLELVGARDSTTSGLDAEEIYRLARRGPLSTAAHAVALVATGAQARSTTAPPELILGLAILGAEAGMPDVESGPSGMCLVGLVAPESSGTVRLASDRAHDRPVVDPGYLQVADDRTRLRTGVRMTLRLFDSEALRGAAHTLTGALEDDAAIDEYVEQTLVTYFHPVGTARMGTGVHSVVSPRLDVHGIDGLWIADASVMPRIPRGLPHAPTIAIAERAAALIRDPDRA